MINKIDIINGMSYVQVPEVDLYIQCGSPAESVKHLINTGIIQSTSKDGVTFETGPNAILLSDVMIQNGELSNLSEFPVLQMLYRQGTMIPNHPNNKGIKPLLIGLETQITSQMQYIYRGNYGLISKQEIESCGIDSSYANELMRMKLKFAFGKLHSASTLLDKCIVPKEKVEIRDGVFIQRIALNIYEISYKDQSVTVNLNLQNGEIYSSPYLLPQYKVEKEYFSVVQSGQGDGWDIDRPSMNSIITFQGKLYLVDVVPNIKYILNALSIAVNEIEGVFLTHTHDDHIAGITSLIRSDKKIKVFASSLVIKAATKKLSALLEIEESEFYNLLDIQELQLDEWNNIEELEVKPVLSPHPVETTVFVFRTLFEDGYKTYGHFADIADSKILGGMIVHNDDNGISEEFYNKVLEEYKQKLDLKKIDIGGGMIHGNFEDFKEDKTSKIILAHNARELTRDEKRVGSSSLFGINDVLIPAKQDFDISVLYKYLVSNFPSVDNNKRKVFLNFDIVEFNPKEMIMKEGDTIENLFLIISGQIEKIGKNYNKSILLKPGTIIGEKVCLNNNPIESAFIAKNYVKLLKIPANFFRIFIEKNNLKDSLDEKFLLGIKIIQTALFEEGISYPTLNKIINNMEKHTLNEGEFNPDSAKVYLVISGEIKRKMNGVILETKSKGDDFGGIQAVLDIPSIYTFEATKDTVLFSICGKIIKNIPIARWKILEGYGLLHQKILSVHIKGDNKSLFTWNSAYRIGINEMDNQHKKLFEILEEGHLSIQNKDYNNLHQIFDSLLEYTYYHFKEEEELLEKYQYKELQEHKLLHQELIEYLNSSKQQCIENRLDDEIFTTLTKDWLLKHILKEDAKYSEFLNNKGIY